METEPAVIAARSEKQAMDWSLVLVSQGIESSIEPPDEQHGWRLLVPPVELRRALWTIHQYRTENQPRPWLQTLPWTGLVFDGRSLLWGLLLASFFVLSETRLPGLRAAGVMDNAAVWSGEWWRLFTAVCLHGDAAHLVANATTGFVLLGLAMGGFGPGLGLLGSFLAGAGGNLAGLLVYPPQHRGLGASGMVLGALGMLTAQWLVFWRAGQPARQLIGRGVFAGSLLMVLLGFNPATDVVAHVGGFLAGGCVGALLALFGLRFTQETAPNRLAELACGGLVLGCWWLALRAAG